MQPSLPIQQHPLFPFCLKLKEHLYVICTNNNIDNASRGLLNEAVATIYRVTGTCPIGGSIIGINNGNSLFEVATVGQMVFGEDVLLSVLIKG